jgi:hypothetical protein
MGSQKYSTHGFFFLVNEGFAVFSFDRERLGFPSAKQNPSEHHRELGEAVELQEY